MKIFFYSKKLIFHPCIYLIFMLYFHFHTLGTQVVTVEAHDYDDPQEANNARLVYSLQKNVIDEDTGRPIFTVDSDTGRISTALCCLDREHTGRYGLLLAATDGGGLQGGRLKKLVKYCVIKIEVDYKVGGRLKQLVKYCVIKIEVD